MQGEDLPVPLCPAQDHPAPLHPGSAQGWSFPFPSQPFFCPHHEPFASPLGGVRATLPPFAGSPGHRWQRRHPGYPRREGELLRAGAAGCCLCRRWGTDTRCSSYQCLLEVTGMANAIRSWPLTWHLLTCGVWLSSRGQGQCPPSARSPSSHLDTSFLHLSLPCVMSSLSLAGQRGTGWPPRNAGTPRTSREYGTVGVPCPGRYPVTRGMASPSPSRDAASSPMHRV